VAKKKNDSESYEQKFERIQRHSKENKKLQKKKNAEERKLSKKYDDWN
jgi:hypothetical protein